MSMSVGSDDADEDGNATKSDINTTPLVDVMLVLLIIFLITIPVITHTVKINLPTASNQPTKTKPEDVTIAVAADGTTYWNNSKVQDRSQLLTLLEGAARENPQPVVHIRADKNSYYEAVGKVIYTIQRAGIVKVSFTSEPGATSAFKRQLEQAQQ